MSAAVTASMRAVGWNVLFTIGPDDDNEFPPHFAGIHQNPRKPTVTFADVRAELALCFDGSSLDNDRNDEDDGNNSRNNRGSGNNGDGGNTARNKPWGGIAFALMETPEPENGDEHVEYPVWITDENIDAIVPGVPSIDPIKARRTIKYHIVRHSRCLLPAGSSLKDHLRAKCAQHLPTPDRYRHPAYIPHNKTPSDSRLNIMPLRRQAKARSQSPPKRSASGRSSPNKPTDDADGEYANIVAPANMDIAMDQARKVISEFRMACINRSACCAITGGGAPWCLGQPIGPGIQACHVVPQQHYHLYPIPSTNASSPDVDETMRYSPRLLQEAWRKTWSPHNGILLMKHMHDFFDARLVSIHPKTLLVRVFVPYQDLEPYHGRKATVPLDIDRRALRHHYDMCCIENMASAYPDLDALPSNAKSQISTPGGGLASTSGGSTPLTGRADLAMTPSAGRDLTQRPAGGDPSKRQRSAPRDDQDDGVPAADEVEFLEEGEEFPAAKRMRLDDRRRFFDGCVTPYNSREFLGDVNWELTKYKAW
ncbi:hypothetical protein MY1884_009624 [Beauveria asiatica]